MEERSQTNREAQNSTGGSERFLTSERVSDFARHLALEERSEHTIEKYLRDVRAFRGYLGGRGMTKELAIAYKQKLMKEVYALRSINSMLASLNGLFAFLGWSDCRVRTIKTQKQIFCPEDRELTKAEYLRLLNAARQSGNQRLELVLQTICGTGVRVSELEYITVEAARRGEATVSCKGKTRSVFLVRELRKKLLAYAGAHGIQTGSIFVTRTGRPLSRTNVWREMKGLCEQARVNPRKVFPHNLRHLFARLFYGIEKDLAMLADILGHSSIDTTRIYIISTGVEHRKRMESMRLIQ